MAELTILAGANVWSRHGDALVCGIRSFVRWHACERACCWKMIEREEEKWPGLLKN